jgi:allantoinase
MKKASYGPFPYVPITQRPKLTWPNGARVALWVIPNIEYFILDHGMPGDENQRPDPNAKNPDVRRWSQREYGNRVGVWRIMDVLSKYDIRATVALNSLVCETHPQVVEAAMALNWEFMGHCQTNTRRLTEVPDDRKEIRTTLDGIEKFTGKRPVGWLGAGLEETWDSLDYLIEAGVQYVADWVADDQPFLMNVDGKRIVSIPYSYDTNDIPIFVYKKYTADECEKLLKRQFDTLYREGAESGRVMAICLHPWVIGMPHRISALDAALDYICGHDGVWKATGSEIVQHYLSTKPTL